MNRLLIPLLLAAAALAQSPYQLREWVRDEGGRKARAGNYIGRGSIDQSSIGKATSPGATYVAWIGYWHPWPVVPRHDVGTAQVLAPGGVADTVLQVTPSARVANYGNCTETFYATLTIDHPNGTPLYRDSGLVTLVPGASYLRLFRPLRFRVRGPYVVRCSTMLATDENRQNDALSHICKVLGRPNWPEGWYEAASMPLLPSGKPAKKGGWLTFLSGAGMFYAAKGNKLADFYRYDPAQDTWGLCRRIPTGTEGKLPGGGATAVSDGNRYIYATKGNNTFGFWRYDAQSDSWKQLPNVPPATSGRKVKGGTDLAFVQKQGIDYVYLLKGSKNDFCRYNATVGYWSEMPVAPVGGGAKWDNGSWLAYDGVRHIYAHKARYGELWKYDTQTDSWLSPALPGIPVYHPVTHQNRKAKDGSSAAWYDSAVYALKGANTLEFWKYDVVTNLWSDLDTIPSIGSAGRGTKVKDGGDIAAFGDGVFFVLKGNKSCQYWRYTLSAEIVGPDPRREGVMADQSAPGDWRMTIDPNPLASGLATVRLTRPTGHATASASISVYNTAGRCILSSVPLRTSLLRLDLRSMPAGVYVVKLTADGFAATQKLVVHR